MEDKEMIAEMAKIMQKCYEKNGLLNFNWFAESAYKRLTKDNVVLSGKQCVEIVQDNYNIGYERGNKETAEKYFNAIIEILKEVKQFETIDIKDLIFLQEKNKEFAKELGVDIKE